MCIAALTGLVPAAGGLLYQSWEQQVGRDSEQTSWRKYYGS